MWGAYHRPIFFSGISMKAHRNQKKLRITYPEIPVKCHHAYLGIFHIPEVINPVV